MDDSLEIKEDAVLQVMNLSVDFDVKGNNVSILSKVNFGLGLGERH